MGWFERVSSNPLSVGVIVGIFALACSSSGGGMEILTAGEVATN
jgi:hypothetical protein